MRKRGFCLNRWPPGKQLNWVPINYWQRQTPEGLWFTWKNEAIALLREDRIDVLCAIPLPKCKQNLPHYIRNQTEDDSERWREEAGQLGNWGPMEWNRGTLHGFSLCLIYSRFGVNEAGTPETPMTSDKKKKIPTKARSPAKGSGQGQPSKIKNLSDDNCSTPA